MNVIGKGFYLGGRAYGENSYISYILSKENGLIKGFTRFSKKNRNSLTSLDYISFDWKSRDKDGLGFLNFNLMGSSKNSNNSFLFELIKASVSELCIKCMPLWEKNIEIYETVESLLNPKKFDEKYIFLRYVWWEFLFLKNIGYGLNLNQCAVSGSFDNIYFISPKSGNSVSYNVGKKYEKKLFKIPKCFKDTDEKNELNDSIKGLEITGYFLKKNFEKKISKLVFREQLINKIRKT